jgi:5-methyltetrahydropteroyltriglutamate--homocysteine methyltransferase
MMRAFVPGIYPRSEALVQATRDLDRGRTTPEAVDEQVERDLQALLSVQQEAGLDHLADGMLRWQDLFRPLIEASDGLETGPLTRFLDTNTFYRAPEAGGEPRLRDALDERYVAPLPDRRLVTLPSPYAFAHGTGLSPAAVAEGVLKPQIEEVDADLIVLSEPFLARDDDPDLGALAAALEKLPAERHLVLECTFGDASALLGRGLADLPVSGIGIDFYATPLDALPELGENKLVLAGVLDARSSVVEDPREIAAFAAEVSKRAAHVALVPNGDLQYVAEPVAREKLRTLGLAKASAVEEAA